MATGSVDTDYFWDRQALVGRGWTRHQIETRLRRPDKIEECSGYRRSWTVYWYRRDRVLEIEKEIAGKLEQRRSEGRPKIKPAEVVPILDAIWAINRHAKRLRDRAGGYWEAGYRDLAGDNAERKRNLYRLKGQALHYLLAEGTVSIVGVHRFPGGNFAEVLSGGGYRFHRPCPPQEADVPLIDGVEAKPKKKAEPRLRDALLTIETYLEGREMVSVYQWEPPARTRYEPEWDDACFEDDCWEDAF